MFFKKKNKVADEFFSYLKIEQDEHNTTMHADIKDEDDVKWLNGVTAAIQAGLVRKGIKNYLVAQMTLGGQDVEIALVKNFKEGPHAMLLKAQEENLQLKAKIAQLEQS